MRKAAWCRTSAARCGCVHNFADFNRKQRAIRGVADALCEFVCRAQVYRVTMACDAWRVHGWDCVFRVVVCYGYRTLPPIYHGIMQRQPLHSQDDLVI